jgi:hypothetical protein
LHARSAYDLKGLSAEPPTEDEVIGMSATGTADQGRVDRSSWKRVLGEVLFILAIFFIYAGTTPPSANEAHYFAKARHYWDPDWCPADVFLNSADAHLVFYWTFGWLTTTGSLAWATWISRLAIWSLLAVAWQRLSWAVLPWRLASVWTAALAVMLMDRFHLAGEWMVGGAEAKGVAYALVLLGLRDLVRDRWWTVWLWFGGASAFHVLIGGWSVVALACCWIVSPGQRPPWYTQAPPALLGLLLALPGLVPVLSMSIAADPGIAAEANRIYVFERLPHHLTLSGMRTERLLHFAILLVLWGAVFPVARRLAAWDRLNRFVFGAVLIAALGGMLDRLLVARPDLAAAVMRFYWFRLADMAVPWAVALAIPILTARWWSVRAERRGRVAGWGRAAGLATGLTAGLFLVGQFVEHRWDVRPQAVSQARPVGRAGVRFVWRRWKAWQDVCHWIQRHTPPDARFLTPRDQQTFKWYAGRSEVACWKDLPQDPRSIVRWWYTWQDVYPVTVALDGLGGWSDEQLIEHARKYQAQYILVDRTRTRRRLGLPRLYPTGWTWRPMFELYEVPPRFGAGGAGSGSESGAVGRGEVHHGGREMTERSEMTEQSARNPVT